MNQAVADRLSARGQGRPPVRVAIAIAIVIAVVVLIADPATSRRAAARQPETPGPPSAKIVTRDAPSAAEAGRGAGGNRVPASSRLLDLEEIRAEMQKARGHTLFVHLWASWCGPCVGELPLMNRFALDARARGATVLSVSLDADARSIARVPALLEARAPALTNFVARFEDPDRFISMFSRSWEGAIPALFVFDRAGKLSDSLVGELEPADLEALLSRLPKAPAAKTP